MFNKKASNPKSKPEQILEVIALKHGQCIADIGAGGGYKKLLHEKWERPGIFKIINELEEWRSYRTYFMNFNFSQSSCRWKSTLVKGAQEESSTPPGK